MAAENAAGHAALDAFIGGVESLRTMNEDVAKASVGDVVDVIRSNVFKGIAPDGSAWPALADGGKPLASAAKDIDAQAIGSKIVLQIGPPLVFHNYGAGGSSTTKAAEQARKRTHAKQKSSGISSKFHAPRRQILPDAGEPLPSEMKDAIAKHAKDIFAKATGGH